jgi:hypothetical protein
MVLGSKLKHQFAVANALRQPLSDFKGKDVHYTQPKTEKGNQSVPRMDSLAHAMSLQCIGKAPGANAVQSLYL